MSNKITGDTGEREVVELIRCPNCTKDLMLLPPNYPLFDVQCTGCSFRAQVKTNRSRPKNEIFGAGWQIMDKVIKSGFTVPPLIAHFKWGTEEEPHRVIRFYPFVPKDNLKKYQLPPTAKRANYWMFKYSGLDSLPYFKLYEE